MSAICFNLDQSEILSSGNGLNEVKCNCVPFGHINDFVAFGRVKTCRRIRSKTTACIPDD